MCEICEALGQWVCYCGNIVTPRDARCAICGWALADEPPPKVETFYRNGVKCERYVLDRDDRA
jgi:hypothetical protein